MTLKIFALLSEADRSLLKFSFSIRAVISAVKKSAQITDIIKDQYTVIVIVDTTI
ncbi:hypothetical protein GCM10027342_28990 [Photobacterium alginatilyticum]